MTTIEQGRAAETRAAATPTAGLRQPVISAWSAVSPFGIGRDAFVEGLHAGRPTVAPVEPEQWQVPFQEACLVPDFDLVRLLGRKGTRAMDRASGLAVTTVGRLLDEPRVDDARVTGTGAGLVLGTTSGSVQSMMDFTREGLVGEKPYHVDPARFPNAVMNCAAGLCAIRHQLKGPNATIAGGRVAGLHALKYTQRLLNTGRARTVLCGAVEEYAEERAWLDWHSREAGEPDFVQGEGCAMFSIDLADAEPAEGADAPLATVLAVELGVFAGTEAAPVLRACVERAVRRAGIDPAGVRTVLPSGAPGVLGEQEGAALEGLFGGAETVRVDRLIGDTAGAAAMFQIAAALAVAERAPEPGRIVLVTAVDRDGEAGCALLRLG